MAAKSRSARFYARSPKARARKNEYQAAFNKKPAQVKKRVELNAYNKKHKSKKTDDAYHRGNRIVGFKSAKSNRGSRSDSPGDRRARGSRR